MVPVTTGPLTTADSGTIPKLTAVPAFYTLSGPRHQDGLLYQQMPGEVAGQRWVTEHTRQRSDHRLLEEEDYDADSHIEVS
ncbi:UNVERIFIED_CONTAM: hypothetical protein K2H54_008827 [Gekko kuhli]